MSGQRSSKASTSITMPQASSPGSSRGDHFRMAVGEMLGVSKEDFDILSLPEPTHVRDRAEEDVPGQGPRSDMRRKACAAALAEKFMVPFAV